MVPRLLLTAVLALEVAALLGFVPLALVAALTCLNENGATVDWWVVLKTPTLSKKSDGTQYAYADGASTHSQFELAEVRRMTSSNSALGYTLNSLYAKGNSSYSTTGWVMYNDEGPEGSVYSTGGHTKGVVGFDASSKLGFWLIHSTPRFPAPVGQGAFSWPSYANMYAQSFLCITFTLDQLDQVGIQLAHNQAHIYDSNMPMSLMNAMPNMAKAISGYKLRTPDASTLEMKSFRGNRFVSFAKTQQWKQDLYDNLVQLYVQDSMWIETWMRPYQPSCCKPACKYDSVNVKTLQLGDLVYSETNDHSKWAVTQTPGKNWVCIGDLNRNISQWSRGGGTMCFQNSSIASMFLKVIQSVDDTCAAHLGSGNSLQATAEVDDNITAQQEADVSVLSS